MRATDVHSAPLDVFFRGVRHAEQRKQPSSASTCNNSPCRQRESGCQSFGRYPLSYLESFFFFFFFLLEKWNCIQSAASFYESLFFSSFAGLEWSIRWWWEEQEQEQEQEQVGSLDVPELRVCVLPQWCVSKQAVGCIPLALLLLGIVIPVQSPSVNSLALASCSRMNLHNPSLYDWANSRIKDSGAWICQYGEGRSELGGFECDSERRDRDRDKEIENWLIAGLALVVDWKRVRVRVWVVRSIASQLQSFWWSSINSCVDSHYTAVYITGGRRAVVAVEFQYFFTSSWTCSCRS
jgi:hypothetical protein